MGSISITDARALFTQTLIAVYRERISPMSFLRSFFVVKESATKEISIEVQRGTEKIAVDVERGTEGNRNSFSKSTQKIFIPPYYREFFDATELDLYDRLFGSVDGTIDATIFGALMESIVDKLGMLQDKIDRSYEKQCADVLQTGVVSLQAATSIDFKRKTTSIVAKSGGARWTDAGISPYDDLETGCQFLRKVGKSQGGIFNAIMGKKAFNALLKNDKFLQRNDLINLKFDAVREPQRNSVGGALHGSLTAGSYQVNIWTYEEFYDNASSVSTPYVAEENVILLPEAPKFILSYAAVPQLIGQGAAPKKGAYLVGDYIDQRNTAHVFDIKSAGVAVPVAVDQIYTLKPVV
jgi:hypothetical protein